MDFPFRFLKVDSNKLLQKVFHLRYQIYCHECEFLNPNDYPDCLEIDQYDSHAIHFAAMDQEDTVVGTIRLIKNSASTPFPIEIHCRPVIESNGLIRNKLAEISRLAVGKKYCLDDNLIRMRTDTVPEGFAVDNVVSLKDFWRRKPQIVLGLYKIMYQESKRQQLTHWFAIMEKKLWRVLNKLGFEFQQIGEQVDYYGPVLPYLANIQDIEKNVYRVNRKLFNLFLEGLEPYYWPEFLRPIEHISK